MFQNLIISDELSIYNFFKQFTKIACIDYIGINLKRVRSQYILLFMILFLKKQSPRQRL